jgi:hypothetical protein
VKLYVMIVSIRQSACLIGCVQLLLAIWRVTPAHPNPRKQLSPCSTCPAPRPNNPPHYLPECCLGCCPSPCPNAPFLSRPVRALAQQAPTSCHTLSLRRWQASQTAACMTHEWPQARREAPPSPVTWLCSRVLCSVRAAPACVQVLHGMETAGCAAPLARRREEDHCGGPLSLLLAKPRTARAKHCSLCVALCRRLRPTCRL